MVKGYKNETEATFLKYSPVYITEFEPNYCPAAGRNPEESLQRLARILRKVLTVETYSQYARKNLDLLEQGPHGIVG